MKNNTLPPERRLIYILLACCLPLFFAIAYYFPKKWELESVAMRIEAVKKAEEGRKKRQAINLAVREKFRGSDRFYIDKNLENLTFLKDEIKSLEKLLSNPDYPQDETLKKRLDFLKGSTNRLIFSEGALQQYAYFREVGESLLHPIEVNRDDLENILSKIEGVKLGEYTEIPPGKPQLIITDFKIQRKPVPSGNDVFLLDMKLLKREFL